MTKSGSFKRAVRRQAQISGKNYTETLAAIESDEVHARVIGSNKWRGKDALPEHLELTYGVRVNALTTLSPHGAGVFRVDRSDGGPPWVARLFPSDAGHTPNVEGDIRILRLLEAHDFPAERCAHDKPLSTFRGRQQVLVTTHVDGKPATAGQRALGDFAGRLHALPVTAADVGRDGGAFGHDPANEGKPVKDISAASGFLDAVEAAVPAYGMKLFESLRDDLAMADGCDGLPEALTTPNVCDRDVILTPENVCAGVDWKPAGWGPRLPALGMLLHGAHGRTHPAAAPADSIHLPMIDAIVTGYRQHITPTDEELDRLAGAIRIYSMYFACWYYWRSVATGHIPNGSEGWWPRHDDTAAIAAAAGAAFRAG
jgi:hypothetical protein